MVAMISYDTRKKLIPRKKKHVLLNPVLHDYAYVYVLSQSSFTLLFMIISI